MSERRLQTDVPLERMPRRKLPPYTEMLLPSLAVGSGALLFLALPDLIDADGIIDYVKCALIAGTATATAYGINRLAIEKGAVQAAIGTMGAALLSTASILLVGAGLFAATYAGFTIERTDRLRLDAYGAAQAAYIDAQAATAGHADRIETAVAALVADLSAKAACERISSCVSGFGAGGEGPVFRQLFGERQRAEALAGQLRERRAETDAALDRLTGLQAEYQRVISDDALAPKERRLQARSIAGRIDRAAGTLDDAASTALVAGYANELGRGASGPAARLLASHGAQLRAVVASIPEERAARPVFPARAGVTDTFAFIGHFLPIALIVGVVELVFPITLWLYSYFALLARVARDDPCDPAPAPRRSSAKTPRR